MREKGLSSAGKSRRRGAQYFHRNVIPRSEATWESVFPLTTRGAVRGEYGLPHQRARWFAMTGYLRVQSKRADRGVRPYGGCGAAAHTGRRGRRPLRSINKRRLLAKKRLFADEFFYLLTPSSTSCRLMPSRYSFTTRSRPVHTGSVSHSWQRGQALGDCSRHATGESPPSAARRISPTE